MAGYSGTPLIQKLGIKPGQRILIVNPPPDYETTLGPLPDGVEQAIGLVGQFDFIHFFTTERNRRNLATKAPGKSQVAAWILGG